MEGFIVWVGAIHDDPPPMPFARPCGNVRIGPPIKLSRLLTPLLKDPLAVLLTGEYTLARTKVDAVRY
jgi:hypothetical protein